MAKFLIALALLHGLSEAFTLSSGSTGQWTSLALSQDGTIMLASEWSGTVWMSSDMGSTWEDQGSKMNNVATNWWMVTMSRDGSIMGAVSETSNVWMSFNSGLTWTERPSIVGGNLKAIAMSSDGSLMVIVGWLGTIWVSTDSGATYSQPLGVTSNRQWHDVVMTDDGQWTLACVKGGNLWMSFDSGGSFIEDSTIGFTLEWRAVASNGDGTIMAAVAFNGNIFLRTDGGYGYAWSSTHTVEDYRDISMSQAGSRIFVAVEYGYFVVSEDAGQTWSQADLDGAGSIFSGDWSSTAVSGDGQVLLCAGYGDSIYKDAPTTSTTSSSTSTSTTSSTSTTTSSSSSSTTTTSSTTTSASSSTSTTTTSTSSTSSSTATATTSTSTTTSSSTTSSSTSTSSTSTSSTSTSSTSTSTTSTTSTSITSKTSTSTTITTSGTSTKTSTSSTSTISTGTTSSTSTSSSSFTRTSSSISSGTTMTSTSRSTSTSRTTSTSRSRTSMAGSTTSTSGTESTRSLTTLTSTSTTGTLVPAKVEGCMDLFVSDVDVEALRLAFQQTIARAAGDAVTPDMVEVFVILGSPCADTGPAGLAERRLVEDVANEVAAMTFVIRFPPSMEEEAFEAADTARVILDAVPTEEVEDLLAEEMSSLPSLANSQVSLSSVTIEGVTRTSTSTSSVATLQTALADLQNRKLALAEQALASVDPSNSSGLLLQTQQELADGTVLVAVVMSRPEAESPVSFGYGNVSVQVPSAILEAIGSGILAVAVMGVTPTSSPLFDLLNSSEGGLQSEILSLDLLVNGTAVTDLVEPLQLSLATSAEPTVCGYLDEERNEWSTSGVSVVSTSEGTLRCAASHLSIFGAILRSAYAALACSNAAAIFSAQGLQSLVKRPSWMIQLSAVLNWLMLMVGGVLLVMARRADNSYQEALDVVPILIGLKRKKLKAGSEQPESLWENLVDGLQNVLKIDPVQMVYSKMIKARTGLSLMALKKLYHQSGHTVLHARTEEFLQEFEGKHFGRQISFWYQMNCVWFNVLHPSAAASCLVRTAVVLGKIYSGWALSAVFYGASSIAPGEEDGCTPVEGLLDQLVRAFVVQLISSFFGSLPFVALVIFFYKLKAAPLWLRRGIFWSFLCCYVLLCLMVVCIFIASVSPVDANKWFYTSAINLIMTWMLPIFLLTAILVVMSFQRGQSGHEQALHHILPWPAVECLETYEITMGSLEVMEQDIKQPNDFLVTCEVAGCSDTAKRLERMYGDVYRVSDCVLTAAQNHFLLFSVHQQSERLPKLRGRAWILVADFLDGFNGKLPLHLNGKALDMDIHVVFHKPKSCKASQEHPSELPPADSPELEETDGNALSPEINPEEELALEHPSELPPADSPELEEIAVETAVIVEDTYGSAEVNELQSVEVELKDEEEEIPCESPAGDLPGALKSVALDVGDEDLQTVAVDDLAPEVWYRVEPVEHVEPMEKALDAPSEQRVEDVEVQETGPALSFSSPEEIEVGAEALRAPDDDVSPPEAVSGPEGSVGAVSAAAASAIAAATLNSARRRAEVMEQVEDENLRDLCNVAAKREVSSLPAELRGQAT